MDSDRVMVAMGYHGDAFHGSQVQPGIRTVAGALMRALERLGWWRDSCLEMSSRTDAGVSADTGFPGSAKAHRFSPST